MRNASSLTPNSPPSKERRGKKAFSGLCLAGDSDFYATSLELIKVSPGAGVDISRWGLCPSPIDGGVARRYSAGQRALLRRGRPCKRRFGYGRTFRQIDDVTPIVLMGYYNPDSNRGVDYLSDRCQSGRLLTGLNVVDLAPREDDELCSFGTKPGLNFIRLRHRRQTTSGCPKVLQKHQRFLVYFTCRSPGITVVGRSQCDDLSRPSGHANQIADRPATDRRILGIKTPRRPQEHRIGGVGWRGRQRQLCAGTGRGGEGASVRDVLAFVRSLADGRAPRLNLVFPSRVCSAKTRRRVRTGMNRAHILRRQNLGYICQDSTARAGNRCLSRHPRGP